MAPNVRVLTRNDVPLPQPQDGCVLKELVQFRCENDGTQWQCAPFRRLFEQCPSQEGTNKGKCVATKRYEVTGDTTTTTTSRTNPKSPQTTTGNTARDRKSTSHTTKPST
ncbi:Som1p KNAG_0E00930 [Huiozyma naganishii CBS 8797]|uniref:Uncharacterized protein n=1 Tax=Huiozyma naganishii (strain ATCC MYA-139 / BCRC 22969 / CBS 8797 / KCTC 17520 / NBRC 10181 / NCYC 3082 / Yp74L-3) TaxID=1071383 RepID=J7S7I7_HUIN7|nr:hypothetical protein KNAG_0E00930 [Kazachstania naganishii CBS 8797]CCK70361.1 hypothetical protein KNAG_0E00930 [Kazachstania naganishii CBS 8797]